MTLTPIDAHTLSERIRQGRATLIDIREADEYAREHIAGAVSLPLSKLEAGHLTLEPGRDAVFHCKSGMRTNANCVKLSEHIDGEAFVLTGGLDAWKQAGLSIAAAVEVHEMSMSDGVMKMRKLDKGLEIKPGQTVELKPGGYQTSLFMLGWTPATSDSHNVLHDIFGCRPDPKDSTRGEANLGGYCNKEVDELTDKVLVEADDAKRNQLIKQAYEIVIKDYGYIPLHQQSLAWGVSKKVKLTQRADNQVLLYWATKQGE